MYCILLEHVVKCVSCHFLLLCLYCRKFIYFWYSQMTCMFKTRSICYIGCHVEGREWNFFAVVDLQKNKQNCANNIDKLSRNAVNNHHFTVKVISLIERIVHQVQRHTNCKNLPDIVFVTLPQVGVRSIDSISVFCLVVGCFVDWLLPGLTQFTYLVPSGAARCRANTFTATMLQFSLRTNTAIRDILHCIC